MDFPRSRPGRRDKHGHGFSRFADDDLFSVGRPLDEGRDLLCGLYAARIPPHNGAMTLPKEGERYSWSDYLAWPEGERYELVDGIAYAMSPAPRRRHQETSRAIFRQIDGRLAGKPCEAYFAPFDVKLSSDESDDAPTVVQPDITVTCDRTKLTEQGMTGPPDLVIEIVSPDSGLNDRVWSEAPLPARPCILGRKFDLYERFRVKEYWIVDQDEKVVEVYRLGDAGTYRRIGAFGPEDTVTAEAVPELSVSLAEVFAEPG